MESYIKAKAVIWVSTAHLGLRYWKVESVKQFGDFLLPFVLCAGWFYANWTPSKII